MLYRKKRQRCIGDGSSGAQDGGTCAFFFFFFVASKVYHRTPLVHRFGEDSLWKGGTIGVYYMDLVVCVFHVEGSLMSRDLIVSRYTSSQRTRQRDRFEPWASNLNSPRPRYHTAVIYNGIEKSSSRSVEISFVDFKVLFSFVFDRPLDIRLKFGDSRDLALYVSVWACVCVGYRWL